ncbi:L,D-transpeptidase [Ferrovibrio sp.]|uniref:L,D-transpeptidase family protein n=1 Tax=Ferrovibrio sp. TaxID=1917215 RepID=UPI0035B04C33
MNDIQVSADGKLRFGDLSMRCALGRSGCKPAADKREGDGATPLGRWPLRRLFYRPDRLPVPDCALPILALTPAMGWCDDPGHADYNRLVTLPFAGSHETLWREDHVYDLIVELGHNDAPPVPGLGSAIFLHLARQDFAPTEGCVAIALADMQALLPRLSAGSAIVIAPWSAPQGHRWRPTPPPAG